MNYTKLVSEPLFETFPWMRPMILDDTKSPAIVFGGVLRELISSFKDISSLNETTNNKSKDHLLEYLVNARGDVDILVYQDRMEELLSMPTIQYSYNDDKEQRFKYPLYGETTIPINYISLQKSSYFLEKLRKHLQEENGTN